MLLSPIDSSNGCCCEVEYVPAPSPPPTPAPKPNRPTIENERANALLLADLPWGLNKGHPTTVRALPAKHSNRKGKSSARTAFVKAIVREVAGFAPYERRVMELIRNSKVRFDSAYVLSSGGGREEERREGRGDETGGLTIFSLCRTRRRASLRRRG